VISEAARSKRRANNRIALPWSLKVPAQAAPSVGRVRFDRRLFMTGSAARAARASAKASVRFVLSARKSPEFAMHDELVRAREGKRSSWFPVVGVQAPQRTGAIAQVFRTVGPSQSGRLGMRSPPSPGRRSRRTRQVHEYLRRNRGASSRVTELRRNHFLPRFSSLAMGFASRVSFYRLVFFKSIRKTQSKKEKKKKASEAEL